MSNKKMKDTTLSYFDGLEKREQRKNYAFAKAFHGELLSNPDLSTLFVIEKCKAYDLKHGITVELLTDNYWEVSVEWQGNKALPGGHIPQVNYYKYPKVSTAENPRHELADEISKAVVKVEIKLAEYEKVEAARPWPRKVLEAFYSIF